MPKILVTGSTGFVGKHLIPKLIEKKNEVLEVTRNILKSNSLFGDSTYKLQTDDPNFKEKINSFKPDIVIHLASYLTSSDEWKDVEKLVSTNILFLSQILNALKDSDLELFINTGTFAEYYNGDNVLLPAYYYAATKTASRSIVDYFSNTYNFKQTTVVPYTIYGGNDSQKKIIDIIYDSTLSETPLDLSPGKQVLDFIHIDDVVDFYLNLIKFKENLPEKSNFKLGTGVGTNLKELSKLIEDISGKKTNINWGGKDYRKSDVMYAVATIDNVKSYFNWTPNIPLKIGVKKIIDVL